MVKQDGENEGDTDSGDGKDHGCRDGGYAFCFDGSARTGGDSGRLCGGI